ncbi:sensor histidine kinase [Streptomyces sp. NPDC086091]|uniref:sensor histidine kinase n=1 Tax=Streptomyces sp. NPDC086091 TaxID=3365751 RepID=UPI0038075910
MDRDGRPGPGRGRQFLLLAAAAAVGVPVWLFVGVLLHRLDGDPGGWFRTGDPLVAVGCLLALLWRRRFPLTVAMTVVIASTASALATGAALAALCSISTRRRPVEIGAVAVAYVTASQLAADLYPVPGSPAPVWYSLALAALTAGIAAAVGMAVGARRMELRSLRERAESAEREQAARAAQARFRERNRIAREMHDVLAHRISLVALQAGTLDHVTDLATAESRALVRGIAEGSHLALEELREVLGVLRSDAGRPEPPQLSADRIPDLVADARASGLDVTLTTDVTGTPADAVGRTCYRVVQEGLTNAAKHAPGAPVHVTLEGGADTGLAVTVRNAPAAARPARRPPVSGFGLPGLTERVGLAGGTLRHHPTPDDGYVLVARLPWPHPTREASV